MLSNAGSANDNAPLEKQRVNYNAVLKINHSSTLLILNLTTMLSFEEAMKEFFLHCMYEKNLSKNTIKFYKIDLVQFSAFLELQYFPLQVNAIDKVHLKAYLRALSVWKPKTIKRKVATLKALFNYLEFEDHVISNDLQSGVVTIFGKGGKQRQIQLCNQDTINTLINIL